MAHSKSAKKRVRQNMKQRLHNRSIKSSLRTEMKKFDAAVASGNAEAAKTALHDVQKKLDKTAAKQVMRKGTADRMKSRLAARLKKIKPAKA